MSDINQALAIALESEQEADAVANTYEGLAQVLDIENSLADVNQANDVAVGLESLQFVLESIQELDATDVALVQVIGDIAGASSGGLNGQMFTPAMEAVDDGGASAGDKAKNITVKIKEMINVIIQKIAQFIEWSLTRVLAGTQALEKAGAQVASMVGQVVNKTKYDQLKLHLQSDLKLIASLPEFLSVVSELSAARTIFSDLKMEEIGKDAQLDKRIVVLQNANSRLVSFGQKYDQARFMCGASYQVLAEKIDDTDVDIASYRISHNVLSVSREKNVEPEQAGEGTVRIGHDLVSAIEDVYAGFTKYQDAKQSGSIPAHIRQIGKLVQTSGAQFNALLDQAMNETASTNVLGKQSSIHSIMGRVLSGLRQDLKALQAMSYIIAAEQHFLTQHYSQLSKTLRDNGQGLAQPAAVAA